MLFVFGTIQTKVHEPRHAWIQRRPILISLFRQRLSDTNLPAEGCLGNPAWRGNEPRSPKCRFSASITSLMHVNSLWVLASPSIGLLWPSDTLHDAVAKEMYGFMEKVLACHKRRDQSRDWFGPRFLLFVLPPPLLVLTSVCLKRVHMIMAE